MAINIADGRVTVGTDPVEIYSANPGCSVYYVGVSSTSSFGARVNIPGIHPAGFWFPLEVGVMLPFKNAFSGITSVSVKGDGGAAVVNHGPAGMHPTVAIKTAKGA